jgi:hypothetical protein
MPVRVLHYRIAFHAVVIDPRGICLFIEDRVLFHSGTISDQFDPRRPTIATPHLVPNSILEVRLVPIGTFGPALITPPPTLLQDMIHESEVIDPPAPPSMESGESSCEEDVVMDELVDFCRNETRELEVHNDPVVGPPDNQRRISTRVRIPRQDLRSVSVLPEQRPVRDRWFYAPEELVDNDPVDQAIQELSVNEASSGVEEPINQAQVTQLLKRFNVEGRNRRNILRARIHQAWRSCTNPLNAAAVAHNNTDRIYTQDVIPEAPSAEGRINSVATLVTMTPHECVFGAPGPLNGADPLTDVKRALDVFLSRKFELTRLGLGGILNANVVFDEFLDFQLNQFDLVLNENKRSFVDEIYRRVNEEVDSPIVVTDELRQQRTVALWAGLRRVYFAEHRLYVPCIVQSSCSPLCTLNCIV